VPRSTAEYAFTAAISGLPAAVGAVGLSSDVHASRPQAAAENRISDRIGGVLGFEKESCSPRVVV
jgi:hypothetical protein